MITKRTEIGKIEILSDGQIQVRRDTVIEEDGVELSRRYARFVLEPSSDTSGIPDNRVQRVGQVVWTPAVVAAYAAAKSARVSIG
jgi:hypothetical protein